MKKVIEPQIISEEDIVVTMEKSSSCGSCKSKKISKTNTFLLILSFYILFSSVYGTIKLIQLLN